MASGNNFRQRSKSLVFAVKNLFRKQVSEPAAVISQRLDDTDAFTQSDSKKLGDGRIQAWYNAVALVFIFVTGCILLSVYYVLEPFLHPLLWAVLIGMVLHPFKYLSSSEITQWLLSIRKSGIPLTVGAVFTPLFLFNWLSDKLTHMVIGSWKMIAGLALGIIVLLFMYILSMHVYVYKILEVVMNFLDVVGSAITSSLYITLTTVLVGFVILVALTKDNFKYKLALQILSSIFWFLIFLSLSACFLGNLAMPAVTTVFITAAILHSTWKTQLRKPSMKEDVAVNTKAEHYLESLESVSSLFSLSEEDVRRDSEELTRSEPLTLSASKLADQEDTNNKDSGEDAESKELQADIQGTDTARQKSSVSFGSVEVLATSDNEQARKDSFESTQQQKESFESTQRHYRIIRKQAQMSSQNFHQGSNLVFVVLSIACLMVMFWKYPLILFILSPFALWSFLKHIFSIFSTLGALVKKASEKVKVLLFDRKWILFPFPLPTILRMYLFVDRMILRLTVKSVGTLASSFIIIGLVVGVATASVFLIFEIQVELSHYATVAGVVWNKTLTNNPQVSLWIRSTWGNQTLGYSFELLAKQGYEYGRVWLAQQIQSRLGDSSSLVEEQMLEFFDKIYHTYFLKDGQDALSHDSLQGIWSDSSFGVIFAELKDLIFNNYETILSVLKSLGSIVMENFSLALSLVYALLQLLFSGGTAFFNIIIFFSALFYLLNSSEERYLPVQWVMDFLPHLTTSSSSDDDDEVTKEHGEAFQRAIRSVFHASLRRFFFYGLYTWLIHTVFAIPVSILPAVLAGIAGALPFVGPYWISLPAALELWLIDSRPLAAIILMVLSVLPVLFIDSIINGEIEGGHPYLTGLAIAGGIYFAGLEGALIGPILLSCLLFFIDIYGDISNN